VLIDSTRSCLTSVEFQHTGKLCTEAANGGGVWSDAELVEAISDPKHERRGKLLEWIGGEFDPEEFDAKAATVAMMKAVRRAL
jgi:hypothetical protein